MAFDGSDACWAPRVPIQQPKKWRLRVAQFGDGYKQRILDGINALETRWSLVWENKPNQILLAMDNYLSNLDGAAFVFEHPVTLVHYTVFCDEWQVNWEVRRPAPMMNTPKYVGSMSAEFYVANGVTVTAIP